jgi:spore coat polysaccharide biosynthesis predicted glycosyltransferase SpsG
VRDPSDVAAVFDEADAAVATAGVTAWELLCMGLPTALICAVDDQRFVGPVAEKAGAAVFLGSGDTFEDRLPDALLALTDEQERSTLSENALSLIDGEGGYRIVDALVERSSAKTVDGRTG